MSSESDYIPDRQSETKPCVLLPIDLQLQSWKEFEEQDLVIKLVIVDNSFCFMTELLSVYFSGNFTVKQYQDQQEVTHHLQRLGCRGILILVEWWAICETTSSSCNNIISTKSFHRKFVLVSGGCSVAPKWWALWRDSARRAVAWMKMIYGWGSALTATVCILGARAAVYSFWVGWGALMGPFFCHDSK